METRLKGMPGSRHTDILVLSNIGEVHVDELQNFSIS